MSKIKTTFFCKQCGNESPKWLGKCPSCNAWNTFVEEIVEKNIAQKTNWKEEYDSDAPRKNQRTIQLHEVENIAEERIVTQDEEFNRVLGGGIVLGSVVLIAGEPGIGKSTLFLQTALLLKTKKTLYISGEESSKQIKIRAERISLSNDNFYLLTEISTQIIFQEIKKIKPDIIIVDSIQTMFSPFVESSPGSITQIKETAAEFQRFAKETDTPVFLIGHINKDGNIAGPKILEHIVDTVLQFEGDRHYTFRIIRTLKNRFGSNAEIGIYEMKDNGLSPVENPSDIFLSSKEESYSGTAIAATIEGIRPMLVEIQALVTGSVYASPQRTVNGFDLRKLQLLLAVLEKRGGFAISNKDVFVNIVGGIRIEDPSVDLAVVVALLSSLEDKIINTKTCFVGEVGLSGEIRAVGRIEQRIAEAQKLGFEKIVISKYNLKGLQQTTFKIKIIAFAKVEELYKAMF